MADDEEVFGASKRHWRFIDSLFGGGRRQPPSSHDIGEVPNIFLARSPSGGIPGATGTWPTITVTPTECELAYINDSNVLGPLLDDDEDPIVEEVCQLDSSPVGGDKIIVCAREYFGFKNVALWELCGA